MKRKQYSTARHVRERYGDRSHVWLWRMMKKDTKFPRPLRIHGALYFDNEELDAYDAERRQPAAEEVAA